MIATGFGEETLRRRLLDTAAELRAMAGRMDACRRDCLLDDARRLEAMASGVVCDCLDPRFDRCGAVSNDCIDALPLKK